MPESMDSAALGRAMDGLERDMARLQLQLDRHLSETGHTGQEARSTELMARINRLELGIVSTLAGVVFLLVRSFIPHLGG